MTNTHKACTEHTWMYIGTLTLPTTNSPDKNKYIYPTRFCSKCGAEQFYGGKAGWLDTGTGAGAASLAFYANQELRGKRRWINRK